MSLSGRIRMSVVTALVTGAGALFAAGCGLLGTAAPAAAQNNNLQSMFQIPNDLQSDPADTLQILRSLGVDIVQVPVAWNSVAASPSSTTTPSGDLYPASNLAGLDTIVDDARKLGIGVDMMLIGDAPLWAVRPGEPPCTTVGGAPICFRYPTGGDFFPSASAYGGFAKAMGQHFAGRVHMWEIWNEANWGPALAPQYYHGSSVPVSAGIYRGMLDAAWKSLGATGHGHDTIVFGSLSQDGSGPPIGETKTSAPLLWTRTLYCVSESYRSLHGSAARQAGCPTSKRGYRSFRRAHPALFSASGLGIHPYEYHSPAHVDFPSTTGAEFAQIPQVIRALDRLRKIYGGSRHLNVYNTEFSWRSRPNDTDSIYSTADQVAQYVNQAEYMSWKNPRIATYDQYELVDKGWFPTGLFFDHNTGVCNLPVPCPKPSFYAYRLPIWLPKTSAKRGRSLEVWGDVRPGHYARIDTGQAPTVQIQFAPSGSSAFQTIQSVRVGDLNGYFDVHVKFPGSGQVRLSWTYPAADAGGLASPLAALSGEPPAVQGPQIFSRVQSISLH
jgi:hypothetical protein